MFYFELHHSFGLYFMEYINLVKVSCLWLNNESATAGLDCFKIFLKLFSSALK